MTDCLCLAGPLTLGLPGCWLPVSADISRGRDPERAAFRGALTDLHNNGSINNHNIVECSPGSALFRAGAAGLVNRLAVPDVGQPALGGSVQAALPSPSLCNILLNCMCTKLFNVKFTICSVLLLPESDQRFPSRRDWLLGRLPVERFASPRFLGFLRLCGRYVLHCIAVTLHCGEAAPP